MAGTKSAAREIYSAMQSKQYSMKSWQEDHELHPKVSEFTKEGEGGGDGDGSGSGSSGEEEVVKFIFVMDLLNFSFWSEKAEGDQGERFQVEYRGRRWMGYWSLIASLRRAVEEGKACCSENPLCSKVLDLSKHEVRCIQRTII